MRNGINKVKSRLRIEHWHIVAIILMVYDIIAVNSAYLLALWLRFDCMASAIPEDLLNSYLSFVPVYTVFCIVIFWLFRMYKSIWRFASYSELVRAILVTIISSVFHIAAITVMLQRMPISYYCIGMVLQFLFVIGIRFSYRFILLVRGQRNKQKYYVSENNAMLIGGGAAGQMILRDLMSAKETNVRVRCIIDDNPNKWNRFIEGVPIVGGRDDILSSVEKYKINKIFVAIPSADLEVKRDILNICKETGCELKSLPGLYQIVNNEITVAAMRDVAVEDLLGREPIVVNMDEIFEHLGGKTILVTGGGGSIGSELCRQIAGHSPKQLIIFDIYENNAYEIEHELRRKYPNLDLVVLIGSVRDSRRLDNVFKKYRPEIVYHAAAHKHVPLMETSPCEAIKNNSIGTYKTACAAMGNGCKKFVLISTDKAVNPTNIMGASKRLCEMIIQSFDKLVKGGVESKLPLLYAHMEDETDGIEVEKLVKMPVQTEFVAVRFGNVLGSNGSVIPLFKRQIENGGPLTVTHPDIIRYFMTIPEAVSLVLQAGVYAKGGEIFVLDMGEPVKIDTLARNLIKLSGYKPDIDIKIEYTGLRPGEKLYEEKLMAEEGLETTPNHLIHIGHPVDFDVDVFLNQMKELTQLCYYNSEDIRTMVHKMVSTYEPEQVK